MTRVCWRCANQERPAAAEGCDRLALCAWHLREQIRLKMGLPVEEMHEYQPR